MLLKFRSRSWLLLIVVDVDHVDEQDVVFAEVTPVFFHHAVKMCSLLLCSMCLISMLK